MARSSPTAHGLSRGGNVKSCLRYFRVPAGAVAVLAINLAVGSFALGNVAGATPTAHGHRGGIFTTAIATNPPNLNHDLTTSLGSAMVERMCENQLFEENGKEEIVPSLATGFKLSQTGLTYTINLRHGVKWQDGVPFTSKDVVFTLVTVLKVSATIAQTLVKVVTSVKAAGTYTVDVHLKQRFAPFIVLLAGTIYVLPKHLYGNQTPLKANTANDHPVGTGPYIMKQWIPDQKIVLVRNPHYWGATKSQPRPWFNEVVVQILTSPQTIFDGLLNGSLDYVATSFLPFTSIKQVMHSSCCRAVAIHGTPSFDIMYTNTASPPFNNATVRKAVYMAITRKLLIQDALGGFGALPYAAIPPTYAKLYTPKINLMKQYPFNPTKAAKMLDDAGYPVKNGERFGKSITLKYSTSTGTFAADTARFFKAALAKLTINVSLVSEDLTSWATQTYVKKSFTLSFIGLTSSNDPALGGIKGVFACQPTPTSEYTNASGYCNKTVTKYFNQAVTATSTAGRQKAYAKAFKIVDKALPSYELGWRKTYVGVSKKVQNWKVSLLQWGGSFQTTWSQSWFK